MKTKVLLTTLLLSCMIAGAKAQTLLWNDGLAGPVKHVVETENKVEVQDCGFVKKVPYIIRYIDCNEQGKMIQQELDDPEYRDDYAKYTYEFDNFGRVVTRDIWFENGELNVSNTFLYDDTGRPKTVETYDGEEDMRYICRCDIAYDDAYIYESEYYSSSLDEENLDYPDMRYTYDPQGNIVEREDSGGDMYVFEYTEWDEYGNWLEQRCYRVDWDEEGNNRGDRDLHRVTVREITYWE